MQSKPKKTRRKPTEVRELLLDAAKVVFKKKGYTEATVDEILKEAGVVRSAMYRHFESKSDLFSHAVLQPFIEFLQEYRISWEKQMSKPWDGEKLMKTVVGLFYDTFHHHRDTLLSIIDVIGSLDSEVTKQVNTELQHFFESMLSISEREALRSNWIPVEGLEMSMRLALGSVAASTMLSQLFIPSGSEQPSRDEIVDHLCALILYGLKLKPTP